MKEPYDHLYRNRETINTIKYVLRIGIAFTFFGHGMYAIAVKPSWIAFLTLFGLSIENAKMIMPFIGILDILVGLNVLICPLRIVLLWAVFWGVSTAFIRFVSGEGFLEFIERGANWAAPLSLLLINTLPAKIKLRKFDQKELEKIVKRTKISMNNFLASFLFL